MKYITIALIALFWFTYTSIPIGTSPYHPLFVNHRFQYALDRGKEGLPTLTLMNQALDSSTRVYGLWMEDHRFYADFQMVGSIYGYGSHLVLDEVHLVDYLRSLDCEYLMYDEKRLFRSAPYFEGKTYSVPTDSELWGYFFEECTEFYQMIDREDGTQRKLTPKIYVWRLKNAGTD